MAISLMDAISWKFTGKPWDLNSLPLTPDEVWAKLDLPPEEVRTKLNGVITIINSSFPLRTTADLTYYVDITLGNDANAGTSAGAGNAFKTIARAISVIPQIVNHAVTINIAAGNYSGEGILTMDGLMGNGVVTLNGDINAPTNYIISSVKLAKCNLEIIVQGLKGVGVRPFWAYGSKHVTFKFVDASTAGVLFCVLFENGSIGKVSSSNLNVSGATAISATESSLVFSSENTGANNFIGLKAYSASKIGKGGTQPGGTTAETTSTGGEII